MHESSLAKELLKVVLERTGAAEGEARGQARGTAIAMATTTATATAQPEIQPAIRRVRAVRGWVAETETLSRESLAFHFAAHARGTVAEGAALELRLVHVEARCRACGQRYAPEHHLLLCPGCGSTEGELLGQTGLGIEALEVE